jgi:adenosylcobyric acid synthase
VVGVLPYLHGLHLDAEDALPPARAPQPHGEGLKIVVPALPRISNHTDFDPLRHHPQVALRFVGPGETLPPADLIILPGTKNTRADLDWLRVQGWETEIHRHLRYGGKLLGICGGFQMLGRDIHDPRGLEGRAGSSHGLGLFDMQTTLAPEKQLHRRHGRLTLGKAIVRGYEIHMGRSTGAALAHPLAILDDGTPDGARSADGQMLGSYLHGLFEHPATLAALLSWAGLNAPQVVDHAARREQSLDRLADTLAEHLDTDWLSRLLHGSHPARRPAP